MKKMIKTTSFLLLFTLGTIAIQDFCQKRTQGFTLSKAKSSSSEKKDLNLSLEEQKSIESILSQPFHFMKKGLQCYAFVSNDEKYVLKLLRWKEIEPSFWTKHLPFSWAQNKNERKRAKKEHDFTSYQIAFEELREETGLIYLHLSKTEGLNTSLCLYDPIKIKHVVPADQIEFILQKKADLFIPFFEENKEDEQKITSFFSHFVTILQNRAQKHLSDSDVSLEYNMGICEGAPILFDIGNLTRIKGDVSPTKIVEQDANLALNWLRQNSPKTALILEKQINSISSEE